jgi:predicted GNAT family N-acyltransferase
LASNPDLCLELLGKKHDRSGFHCGVQPLDRYLQRQASQDMRKSVANTFVLAESDTGKIAGYFTISATCIRYKNLPEIATHKLPKYKELPATLIGRLAVDMNFRGQKLGTLLLHAAFKQSLFASRTIASCCVLVDAKDDDARAFYLRHDFKPVIDDPMRLYIPMSSIITMFPSMEN